MPSYRIVIDTKSQTRKEKEKEQLKDIVDGVSKATKNDEDDDKYITKEDAAKRMAVDAAVDIALQVGKLYVDTIGVRTDNAARQNQVNNIMDIAGKAMIFGAKVFHGAKDAGPAGAVIAAVATLATEAVNIASNVMQYKRDIAEDAASTMHASERLGMVATDRNRRR